MNIARAAVIALALAMSGVLVMCSAFAIRDTSATRISGYVFHGGLVVALLGAFAALACALGLLWQAAP